MVSGIGPKTTLEKYNIPVVSHLPGVGQGLQDQPLFAAFYNVSVPTNSALSNATYAAGAIQDYLFDQTGPLTNPGYNEVGKLYANTSILSDSSNEHRMGETSRLISSSPLIFHSLRPLPLPIRLARNRIPRIRR